MTQQEHQDEWMQLCQLNQRFVINHCDDSTTDVDWSVGTRSLPQNIVRECPKWIFNCKRTAQEQQNNVSQRQLPAVNIQALTSQQRLAFNIVDTHYRSILGGEIPDPLHMIICGTAGTGNLS